MYIVTNPTVKLLCIMTTTWIASYLAKTNETKPPYGGFVFLLIVSDSILAIRGISIRAQMLGATERMSEPYFLYGERLSDRATTQMSA